VWGDEDPKLQLLDSDFNDLQRFPSKFRRIAVIEIEQADVSSDSLGTADTERSLWFNTMIEQYNELNQQTMMEMDERKGLNFWNPLESMSKKDATS
jgi:hypothetical protein